MFALIWGDGMNFAFPDVCNTPLAAGLPVPVPYPNISETATNVDPMPNVLMDCMPTINMAGVDSVSEGDDAGVQLGVASFIMSGQTGYLVGSVTTLIDGLPAMRLTSVTQQNCMVKLPNSVGMTIEPGQFTVLTLG